MSTLLRTAIGAAMAAGLAWSGAMAGTSPAEQAKADDNECVFSSTLHDWRVLDSSNLVVWAPNRDDAYHVTLNFAIPDLRSQESLAFVDGNHDGRVCGFGMDEIVITQGSFPERSTIRGMTRLDEAGLAALSERYHVKLTRKPKS